MIGVAVEDELEKQVRLALSQVGGRNILDGPPPPCHHSYDILIPVYDGYDDVKRCVESVLKHSDARHSVYLLDDASPDQRILPMLQDFAEADPRVKVLPAERNVGFVVNVNRGLELSRNNVVVLNSDTKVTPGWLERMDRCLRSDRRIGIVSPLSNNATLLSVPVMNYNNQLPEKMTIDSFAELVSRSSTRSYPRLPTAHGFCMLISRLTLDRIGNFDLDFGLGYGEENDFCMRAWQAGIESVCCDDAYVYHNGKVSFNSVEQIDEHRQYNQKMLNQRWPNYVQGISVFFHINPLREVQERIETALYHHSNLEDDRSHILYVIHNFGVRGGTELHTHQILDGLAPNFRSTVVYPDCFLNSTSDMVAERKNEHLRVVRVNPENVAVNNYFCGLPGDLTNSVPEWNFARLVTGGDYDIVFFQHMLNWGTMALPLIAKALGKGVILSLRDYFLLCPEYNLITPKSKRCGKIRADHRDEECLRCLEAKHFSPNIEKAAFLRHYISRRFEMVRRIFRAADFVVVHSNFVRDHFLKAFSDELSGKLRVIPHGTVINRPSPRPPRSKVLRVGFVGNFSVRKGAHTFLDAANRLRGKPVQMEVFGGIPPDINPFTSDPNVIFHGPYSLAYLSQTLEKIDLVAIISIWNETFCHTLNEVQKMGVPILATDVGAISERIIDGKTGFLIPPDDPRALEAKLLELAADPNSLTPVIEGLKSIPIKIIQENILDYASLLNEMMDKQHQISRNFYCGLHSPVPGASEPASAGILTECINM